MLKKYMDKGNRTKFTTMLKSELIPRNLVVILCVSISFLFSCKDDKVKVKYATVDKKYVLPEGVEVNGLKQGLWIEYSIVGFIKSIVTYVDGVEEGETIYYNEHGIIIQKIQLHQGKFHGVFECFNDNGILTTKGVYIDNKKTGYWFYYDDKGKLIEQEQWDKGKMQSKKVFH